MRKITKMIGTFRFLENVCLTATRNWLYMKKSYIQQLRQKIGHQKIIHPAARIVIENDKNEFLFILRSDNKKWGIPAGALEEDETIEQCIRREVLEETGLTLGKTIVTGISSDPKFETVTYPNQDVVQYFTVNFYCNDWTGDWKPDVDESLKVQFFSLENMSPTLGNEKDAFDSYFFYKKNQQIKLA